MDTVHNAVENLFSAFTFNNALNLGNSGNPALS